MNRTALLLSSCLALTACGGEEPSLHAHGGHTAPSAEAPAAEGATEASPEGASAGPAPAAVLPDGARLFGTALSDRAPTPLADISANPDAFNEQVVRTSGTIERVCQAMGCWMELRAEGVAPVRVPMAGHSFFLPRDVAGRAAEIEGRVAVRPLTDDVRRHLESEGAVATASALSIDATGVVVR
jgi:Domain of unknown function (DUF4920)